MLWYYNCLMNIVTYFQFRFFLNELKCSGLWLTEVMSPHSGPDSKNMAGTTLRPEDYEFRSNLLCCVMSLGQNFTVMTGVWVKPFPVGWLDC